MISKLRFEAIARAFVKNKLLMLLFDCLYVKLRYDGDFFVRNLVAIWSEVLREEKGRAERDTSNTAHGHMH